LPLLEIQLLLRLLVVWLLSLQVELLSPELLVTSIF
jgi:hypothetical protein